MPTLSPLADLTSLHQLSQASEWGTEASLAPPHTFCSGLPRESTDLTRRHHPGGWALLCVENTAAAQCQ